MAKVLAASGRGLEGRQAACVQVAQRVWVVRWVKAGAPYQAAAEQQACAGCAEDAGSPAREQGGEGQQAALSQVAEFFSPQALHQQPVCRG